MSDSDSALPAPRPAAMTANLQGWLFDVRDGWASAGGDPPTLVSPSERSVIQVSLVQIKSGATTEFLNYAAKSTLESAGVLDPVVGEPMTVASGEQFVGGRGALPGEGEITAMVCGKHDRAAIMTFLHDGQDQQEQADAEATLASARFLAPSKDGGPLKRLFRRG